MARTIVLAAPAQQLSKVVGNSQRCKIYDHGQPVWEDHDNWREAAATELPTGSGANEVGPGDEPPA